ncbi:unnamed protein product [[Candida] boidinii]|nr:hypothetical protein BVG19_g4276 [[Candida] boidinii]OWB53240.1 hypothetical protein B5S27_g4833 [[Candida] boidinii]OWB85603.1 hypothetical protein B5S33_g4272 [[Candida] boidinii]GMF45992.1 unnamed protein product [[Candida] boidinii]
MSEENIYDVDRNAEEATTTTNTLGINSNNIISTLGNDAKHQELMEAMEAISLMLKQIMQTMNKADNNINPSGDNEDVLPPPVNTSSALDEFEEEHSGLFLFFDVVWIVNAIVSIVIGCQEWSHSKALSLYIFSGMLGGIPSVDHLCRYCYKRRARIWNFFGYQIDDNNHRYTIAADKKSKGS